MKDNIVVEFVGNIQHFYERGDDLIVLPKGRSRGENMYPYGKNVKVTITYLEDESEAKDESTNLS